MSTRIRQFAEAGKTHCTLVVPDVVWGQPMYDRSKAREYLVRQFSRLGFRVIPVRDFECLISWKK